MAIASICIYTELSWAWSCFEQGLHPISVLIQFPVLFNLDVNI